MLAYNSGDLDGVLDCLTSTTRSAYKLSMGLVESIGGMGISLETCVFPAC